MKHLDFQGEWISSYIDGSKIRYFSSKLRNTNVKQSVGVVGSLILLVVGIVVSIYIIRFTITDSVGAVGAQVVASVANAIQIQILNYVYSSIAIRCTERENHRTDTQVGGGEMSDGEIMMPLKCFL